MSGFRKAILDKFMKTITNTTVFQAAYKYLVEQGAHRTLYTLSYMVARLGKADADFDTFYPKLFELWYGTYSRCHHGALGSSGKYRFSLEFGGTLQGEAWVGWGKGFGKGRVCQPCPARSGP